MATDEGKTAEEIGRMFGVTRMSISNWVKKGLPRRLVGLNRYRYDVKDVYEFLWEESWRNRPWLEVLRDRGLLGQELKKVKTRAFK